MQLDVELALIDMSADDLNDIKSHLPTGFYVEDRSDKGWGLVVRAKQKLMDDFNGAINAFLEPLTPMINIIRNHTGLLRVGVFYNTVNCTMRLNSFDRLSEFGLPIEISTYPSSDEE